MFKGCSFQSLYTLYYIKLLLFADDTSLCIIGHISETTATQLKRYLVKRINYLFDTLLAFLIQKKTAKTESVIFSS